jgi:hypothetical protein
MRAPPLWIRPWTRASALTLIVPISNFDSVNIVDGVYCVLIKYKLLAQYYGEKSPTFDGCLCK